MVKTMEWQGQSLLLLDQTKLPSEIITILCKDYRRVGEAIKRLEVRGAPAIGAAAAFGLIPAFGLDLALCIDFGRLAGRGDAGIDRGLALFRDFGLLAEEDDAEGGSWQHGCLVFG